MRSALATFVTLGVSIVAVTLLPTMVSAQVATPEYLVLDTAKTSTMQQELQQAADRGYRLVPGQGSWTLSAVLEKGPEGAEPIEFLLLATTRSATMQTEMNDAASRGYRFASVLGIGLKSGDEVIIAMQRRKGTTNPTHQQVLLAASRIRTVQKELQNEAAKGYRFVGQTLFNQLLRGYELVSILERPVQ